jgi:serine/threonine protein kinase
MEACAGDDELHSAIEEMLAADKRAAHFLEESPADIAAAALMARNNEALIGRTLGEYLIAERLGTGGMGEVFLANDSRLRRKVALKFLSREGI